MHCSIPVLRNEFLSKPKGSFEPRAVVVGWRAVDQVQIISGLQQGEKVVSSGTFLVDSESRLQVACHGSTSRHRCQSQLDIKTDTTNLVTALPSVSRLPTCGRNLHKHFRIVNSVSNFDRRERRSKGTTEAKIIHHPLNQWA